MKKSVFALLTVFPILFSCSSDKKENSTDTAPSAIIGTWDATEFNIDNNTASDDAKIGREILEFLTNKNCVIITLQFNADLTASATNSANYIDVQTTAMGFDIPCPTQSDVESSTYTFDGAVVTFLNTDGQTETVEVSIVGDRMTVNAADLDIPDFDEAGELIFVKR